MSDALWERIDLVLPIYEASPRGGRPRLKMRKVVAGVLYVLATGCQWKAMPREFGSGSAIYAYFQEWAESDVFEELWQLALAEYDELKGIAWKWQSLDGALTKAALGGEKNRQKPDRSGKLGVKRSTLVDGRGVPLAVAVAAANVPDSKLVAETLKAIPIRRPEPTTEQPQHLCLDKGYAGAPVDEEVRERGYMPHVPRKANEPPKPKHRRGKACRWKVERTHALLAQSGSTIVDPLGEEGRQLSRLPGTPLRNRHPTNRRSSRIGSKGSTFGGRIEPEGIYFLFFG